MKKVIVCQDCGTVLTVTLPVVVVCALMNLEREKGEVEVVCKKCRGVCLRVVCGGWEGSVEVSCD